MEKRVSNKQTDEKNDDTLDWLKTYVEFDFQPDPYRVKHREAMKIKHEHFPEMLYKYRSCDENSIKNFSNDTIWASAPSDFNDPFDSVFTYSHKKILEDIIGKEFFEKLIAQNHMYGVELTEEEIAALRVRPYEEGIYYLRHKDGGKRQFCGDLNMAQEKV